VIVFEGSAKFRTGHNSVTAAVCGQLGRAGEGRASIQALRDMKVDPIAHARTEFIKWIFDTELIEHVLQGLRKAGLESIEPEVAKKQVVASKAESGTQSSESGSSRTRPARHRTPSNRSNSE
jgi:hypothetical protein